MNWLFLRMRVFKFLLLYPMQSWDFFSSQKTEAQIIESLHLNIYLLQDPFVRRRIESSPVCFYIFKRGNENFSKNCWDDSEEIFQCGHNWKLQQQIAFHNGDSLRLIQTKIIDTHMSVLLAKYVGKQDYTKDTPWVGHRLYFHGNYNCNSE